MTIVVDFPPNYDQIAEAFDISNRPGIVFAYGDKVYTPNGDGTLPIDLQAHEQTHLDEQEKIGVDEWWSRYLSDAQFRLEQEVMAYRNQYRCAELNRQQRREILSQIVRDLSSSMYGNMITKQDAKRLICQ